MAGRTQLLLFIVQKAQTDTADHAAIEMAVVQQSRQMFNAVLDRDASHLDGLELVGQGRVPLAGGVGVSAVGLSGTQHGHAGSLLDGGEDGTGGIECDGGDGRGVGQLDDGQVDDGT